MDFKISPELMAYVDKMFAAHEDILLDQHLQLTKEESIGYLFAMIAQDPNWATEFPDTTFGSILPAIRQYNASKSKLS